MMTRTRGVLALASIAMHISIGPQAVIGELPSQRISVNSVEHAHGESVAFTEKEEEKNNSSSPETNPEHLVGFDSTRWSRRRLSWWELVLNLIPTVSTPTVPPTLQPSSLFSRQPSPIPTPYPTYRPTPEPTPHPTNEPTNRPTDQPTLRPSMPPTPHPTQPDLTDVISQPNSAGFWIVVSQIIAASSAAAIAVYAIVMGSCHKKSGPDTDVPEEPTYYHKMRGSLARRLDSLRKTTGTYDDMIDQHPSDEQTGYHTMSRKTAQRLKFHEVL